MPPGRLPVAPLSNVTLHSVSYRIDSSDRIVFTDDAWFEFARQNDFENADVLGTSLWPHITDQTTAHLYKVIIARVRTRHRPAHVTFRCDAPTVRRFMWMEIAPESAGAVLFRTFTGEEHERPRMPLLDATVPRGKQFLKICGWCKRIPVGAQWVEIEEAVDQLGLMLSEALPKISHCICPECEHQVGAEN